MLASLLPRGKEDDAWLRRLRERVGERRADRCTTARVPIAAGASPLLSVVVLNWNGAAVIERCLEHLGAQTLPRLEVVAVDNGSIDESLPLLRERARRGELRLIESAANRGVGGGRNLGIASARGEIVAFLDNDAFPDPTWAAEIVRVFASDPSVGGLASLVFFDGHKAILNSAGGTLNLRGHGADWCFNTPYEFAALPEEVLYPTGCGMAFRRDVLAAIGPHDDAIPYYGYDDVEVGLRTRALGRRVVLARAAWIDHEGGHSARLQPEQALWRERGRIRNALKYFPARRLPRWLVHEAQMLDYLRSARTAALPLRAWVWNLRHLRSALGRRRQMPGELGAVETLLHRSWRGFPWLQPDNRAFRPSPRRARSRVVLDGRDDRAALGFGWYATEREAGIEFRRSAAVASLLVRAETPRRLTLTWRAARSGQQVGVRLRNTGEIDPIWKVSALPAPSWETSVYDCAIPAGLYELVLEIVPTHSQTRERGVGVAVARVELD